MTNHGVMSWAVRVSWTRTDDVVNPIINLPFRHHFATHGNTEACLLGSKHNGIIDNIWLQRRSPAMGRCAFPQLTSRSALADCASQCSDDLAMDQYL